MTKSPCLKCKYKEADKRKEPACIDCWKREAYAAAFGHPTAGAEMVQADDREPLANNRPEILSGFELHTAITRVVSVLSLRAIVIGIPKVLLLEAGDPERANVFFHPVTAQIAIQPDKNGIFKVSRGTKNKAACIASTSFMKKWGIPKGQRIPAEYRDGVIITTERVKCRISSDK